MRGLFPLAAVIAGIALAVVLTIAIRRDAPPARVAAPSEPPISGATGAPPAAARELGAIEGTVRDLTGAPLAGVHVRLVSRGDGLAGAPEIEVRTDFEGSFRIDGVEPGRAALVAHECGVAIGATRAVRVAPGRTARADVVLAPLGFLAGRVSADPGQPAEVITAPLNAGLGALQVARTPVDARGEYRIALPAGEYRLYAAPAGAPLGDLRAQPAFAVVRPGGTTHADLTVSAVVTEPGVAVRVNEPAGAPSPGAIVTVSRAGESRVALATIAGEDGRAVVAGGMGVAGRRVTIHARNGDRAGEWTGDFPETGEVVIALRPEPAAETAPPRATVPAAHR